MATAKLDTDTATGGTGPTIEVIDACAFPAWPGTSVLVDYMDAAWRELIIRPRDPSGPASLLANPMYVDPRKTGNPPKTTPSSHAVTPSATRIVMGWNDGILSTALPDVPLNQVVVRAANAWLVDQLSGPAGKHYGMLLAATAAPDVAAKEIRRVGAIDRIVAIALGCNSLGRPFGDRIYLPIFQAAAELDLPVVLQVGSDEATDHVTPPVAGGMPATYAEYRALSAHSHMAHVGSMIVEGLFERFPQLKVLLIGGGVTWIPSWLWRLEAWTKVNKRTHAPWLTQLPTDYFLRHVRTGTYGLESPQRGERIERALRALDGIENVIMYASGFPDGEWENPDDVMARLPETWAPKILANNAQQFFRWPR